MRISADRACTRITLGAKDDDKATQRGKKLFRCVKRKGGEARRTRGWGSAVKNGGGEGEGGGGRRERSRKRRVRRILWFFFLY